MSCTKTQMMSEEAQVVVAIYTSYGAVVNLL